MIEYQEVSKSYDKGHTYAVLNISFDVREGETLVLLGSSGCGKTTLLKLTNRLIEPTSGSIELNGEDISQLDPILLRRRIGYVFQGIGLFPHMSIEENTTIIPRLLGWPYDKRKQSFNDLMNLVGLDPISYADRYPKELSGGQQQRIGVARALAADPEYLLMDEPFGALDALTRDTLQQELLSLKERLQKTIIFVTHDIFEALTLADRIAILHKGNLEQIGTKDDILGNPRTDFVRNLFEKPARQLAAYKDLL
ncbi:MAG: ATP-binding cassette domain-containing protein [Desulfobacteraceae bacterium]|nr:ATP-binding cassette domain-containing protein [Desulfobacteraceae bacterium]MBC2757917.1 ATP-binding cassette domain-containing protein [Desulfobacteraceae bacterium]